MRLGPRCRATVVVLIAGTIGSGGCALMMKQSPKKDRGPGEVPICSSGRGGVVLDSIAAGLLGVGALVAIANDEAGAGVAMGAIGGLFTVSAVSGHRSASDCEEAAGEYQSEIMARGADSRSRVGTSSPPRSPPTEAGTDRAFELAPPVPVADPVSAPAPAPAAAPAPPPPAPAAAPAPPPPAPPRTRRDWSDFWIEVKP
jgi:hypothetical protein